MFYILDKLRRIHWQIHVAVTAKKNEKSRLKPVQSTQLTYLEVLLDEFSRMLPDQGTEANVRYLLAFLLCDVNTPLNSVKR